MLTVMVPPPSTLGALQNLGSIGPGRNGNRSCRIDERINLRVAIKLLNANTRSVNHEELTQRLRNEASAVNQIVHPGVVRIYRLDQLDDGTTYVVMELLLGEDLRRRLASHEGRLPIMQVTRFASLTANVMIVPDPDVPDGERTKVLDFGIAKLFAGNSQVNTRTGAIFGTPSYMSPDGAEDLPSSVEIGPAISVSPSTEAAFASGAPQR